MPRKATGRPAGRPKGSIVSPRGDLDQLAQIHREQLRFWRHRQVYLRRCVERAEAEAVRRREKGDLDALPEVAQAVIDEYSRIDVFIQRANAAMLSVRKTQEQEQAQVPTEQLEAQFAAELLLAIRSWTPDQWRAVFAEARKLGITEESLIQTEAAA